MARPNGTAATAPTCSPYAEWFEEWTDDHLALFISACRSWAAEPGLNRSLSNAADIAGRLAESVLSEREDEHERITAMLNAEIDARREYDAMLAALPNDLPDFSGEEVPF